MRLFIGIPLAPVVLGELTALTEKLRAPDDGLRWSAAPGLHITLQFLGATRHDQLPCLLQALGAIAAGPFSIELEAPGCFERAGVFFAAVRLSPRLAALQHSVTTATRPCGFLPEDRPYRPHITLARAKGGRRALTALEKKVPRGARFSPFTAEEFSLYESFPGPGGSRYEVRARFPLRARDAET